MPLGTILGNAFFDLFLDMTPKANATKLKINKWDYIKHKNVFTTKQIINKMEMEENLKL